MVYFHLQLTNIVICIIWELLLNEGLTKTLRYYELKKKYAWSLSTENLAVFGVKNLGLS